MLCSWDDYTVLSWLMKTWTGYVTVYVAILAQLAYKAIGAESA